MKKKMKKKIAKVKAKVKVKIKNYIIHTFQKVMVKTKINILLIKERF